MPPRQTFVKALSKVYPELEIIVLSFEYPFDRKNYQWNGLEVMAFGGGNKSRLPRLHNWVSVWQALGKLYRQKQVVGLLSFWVDECAFIGHYFAKTHGLKHYTWILGQDARAGNRYFKWIRPKAASLIALSDFIARETEKNYGVYPSQTIITGIDPVGFKHHHRKRDIDILGAGSLIPLKQFDIFIKAISFLKTFLPDIHTVICGDGPEKVRLQLLISRYRLEDNITLVGELPHAEVLGLMQRSKIFLHTSNYEGFGTVLLEGLYGGAQVVSFVKPMDAPIKHHHVVNDLTEMCHCLLDLLQEQELDQEPVLAFPIRNAAIGIMKLFGYSEPAIC